MRAQKKNRKGFTHYLLAAINTLFQVLVGLLAVVGFATVAVIGIWVFLMTRETGDTEPKAAIRRVATPVSGALRALEPEPDRPHVIYLNREGGVLTAGVNDSRRNVSSVVANAGLESFEVPSYHGTNAAWDSIVSCVQDQFSAYDVEVVDQRPVDGPYTMVMMGGRAGELQNSDGVRGGTARNLSGLAPMNGRIVENAVVFVFARSITGGSRIVCETVAHEVGHVYGLDHAMDRRDPMTYLPRSSRRSFQDTEAQCGERATRLCADGEPTQNSHQHLLEVLGPNRELAADGQS